MIPLTFVISAPSEGADITNVTVFIEDKGSIIDLKTSNSTSLRGNVTVITTSSEPVIVELKALFSGDQDEWTAEFSPKILFYGYSGKEPFEVSIEIPMITVADHYSVTIGGYWKYESDTSWNSIKSTDQVFITVAQYHSVSIIPEETMIPFLELDKTGDIYYKFFLSNDGNGKDSITFEILNELELVDLNWDIKFTTPPIELNAFQAFMINLSMKPPSPEPSFLTKIHLKINSEDGSSSSSNYFDLYIYSESDRFILAHGRRPLVILRPLEQTTSEISPGDTFKIKIEARCYIDDAYLTLEPNLFFKDITGKTRGSFGDRSDLSKETKLQIEITPDSLHLEPGDTGIFTIEITGINETSRPSEFFELIIIEARGNDIVGNPVSLEFYYLTFGFEEEKTVFPITAIQAVMITAVGSIVAAAAVVAGTEFGKYRFLLLFFIPLYTKIHKDKVLDHFTRGRIYEYIRSHPGSHFSELKRELKLTNGGLAYHLFTLEREELVRSYRSGKLKLFYTRDFGIPKEEARQFSELEALILQIIDENPGISQREVGEAILNRNHRTVSHNIKQLSREGYVRLEKSGRSNQCFIDYGQIESDGESQSNDSDAKKSSMIYRI